MERIPDFEGSWLDSNPVIASMVDYGRFFMYVDEKEKESGIEKISGTIEDQHEQLSLREH